MGGASLRPRQRQRPKAPLDQKPASGHTGLGPRFSTPSAVPSVDRRDNEPVCHGHGEPSLIRMARAIVAAKGSRPKIEAVRSRLRGTIRTTRRLLIRSRIHYGQCLRPSLQGITGKIRRAIVWSFLLWTQPRQPGLCRSCSECASTKRGWSIGALFCVLSTDIGAVSIMGVTLAAVLAQA